MSGMHNIKTRSSMSESEEVIRDGKARVGIEESISRWTSLDYLCFMYLTERKTDSIGFHFKNMLLQNKCKSRYHTSIDLFKKLNTYYYQVGEIRRKMRI